MNREELIKAIKKLHVPPYLYNLEGSGRNDERFCLVKKDGLWNVFYAERGKKTTDLLFTTESEALEYLIREFSR